MILDVILACPICQVKHEDGLNYFTSRERYRELWGLGWWTDYNLISFSSGWVIFKNCTDVTRKMLAVPSQSGYYVCMQNLAMSYLCLLGLY